MKFTRITDKRPFITPSRVWQLAVVVIVAGLALVAYDVRIGLATIIIATGSALLVTSTCMKHKRKKGAKNGRNARRQRVK